MATNNEGPWNLDWDAGEITPPKASKADGPWNLDWDAGEITPPAKKQDGAFSRGWNKARQSMAITRDLVLGDADGAAQTIAEADRYAKSNPGMQEGRELMQAWDRGDGITGGIKEVAGEFRKDWVDAPTTVGALRATGRNLRAMGEGVAEQTGNMVAPVAGMLAGAKAGGMGGAAIGTAIAPGTGTAVGGAVGGVAGGWAGASAGSTLIEGGYMAQEALNKAGIDPQDTAAVRRYISEQGDSILGDAATKGAIIGAVDMLTMRAGHLLLSGPGRAATSRALSDMGVDIADKAAAKTAMSSPEFAQRIASDVTYQASRTGTGNVSRNVGAAALDPAGEFAGEYLGTGVATGDWDTKNAALEAFSGVGQSAVMYGGQKAYERLTRPRSSSTGSETTTVPEAPGQGTPLMDVSSGPTNTKKDFEEALKEQVEPQIIIDEGGRAKSTTSKYEIDLFHAEIDARLERQQRNIEAGRRLQAARLTPSEQMGLDPAAGPLSAAAARAVDDGASQLLAQAADAGTQAEQGQGATQGSAQAAQGQQEASAQAEPLSQAVAQPARLTPEAEQLLASVDAGGVPAMITQNLRRIAAENGVEVTRSMRPDDVVSALRDRAVPEAEPVRSESADSGAVPTNGLDATAGLQGRGGGETALNEGLIAPQPAPVLGNQVVEESPAAIDLQTGFSAGDPQAETQAQPRAVAGVDAGDQAAPAAAQDAAPVDQILRTSIPVKTAEAAQRIADRNRERIGGDWRVAPHSTQEGRFVAALVGPVEQQAAQAQQEAAPATAGEQSAPAFDRAMSMLMGATDGNGAPDGLVGPEHARTRTEIVSALTGVSVADIEAAPNYKFRTSVPQVERLLYDAAGVSPGNLRDRRARFVDMVDQATGQRAPEPMPQIDDDPQFSFAGQRAQGADRAALDTAQQRIQAGQDADVVRQETGWHRGADSKWRYEISDDQAGVVPAGQTFSEIHGDAYMRAAADGRQGATVGDVLQHDALFAAYPQLHSIPVELVPADSRATARFLRRSGQDVVQVAAGVPRDRVASAMLHELQHAIQLREGFAVGGSAQSGVEALQSDGSSDYRRLAGEVEARNVQTRQRMTPAQRALAGPDLTSDTRAADVIVTFNGRDVVNAQPPANAAQSPAQTVRITPTSLARAFEVQFPNLAPAVRTMLERGRRGEKGGAVLIDSTDTAQIARVFASKTGRGFDRAVELLQSDAGAPQGFFDPKSGLTFLIGPQLDLVTAPAVLLHEMVHGQQRQRIDARALEMIEGRDSAAPAERAFLYRVAERMRMAGETGNASEAAAYIVEEAVLQGRDAGFTAADSKLAGWIEANIGGRVAALVRSFIMSVRSWMVRHGMPMTGPITVDDLVSYAKVGVEQAARGNVVGGEQQSYSQQSVEGAIQVVLNAAREPGHAPQKAVLGQVSNWLANSASAAGLNIAGYSHVIDGSSVRHIIKNHFGAGREKARGQLPMSDADLLRLAEVIQSPDSVVFGTKNRLGKDQVAYVKRMDDGSILYLEEVRSKRQEMAAVSARKYPATMNVETVVSTLHPNAQGDGGNGVIVVAPPGQRNDGSPRFSRASPVQKILAAGEEAVAKVDGWLDRSTRVPDEWSPQQKAAAGKFATFSPRQPIKSMLRGISNRAKDRAAQLIFDQFRPLRNISEEAFMTAHLSKATDGALEAMATLGIPVLRDGALAVEKQEGGGFLNDLANGLGSAQEANQFLMWVAANRAEKLMAEGRENLFTREDIAAMKGFNKGQMPDGRPRPLAYAQMNARLNAYNKAVLDIAEQAGLINAEARKGWESEFYIPFYRVAEESGDLDFSAGGTGLARQKVIQQLKGGKENLGDPLANIMANWHMMLTASMRNMAANKALKQGVTLGIAQQVTVPALAVPASKGGTWTMQNGQKVLWQVSDPMVAEALEALNFTGYNNPAMRAASKFKHLLTVGVTISPTFRVRNLMRDALQAVATADVGYNPLKNAVEGWKLTGRDSDTMAQLMAGGGAVRFGSFNDGQQAEYAKRLIAMGVKDNQILDTPSKLKNFFRRFYDSYQETGDRAETINRAVIYQRVLAETGDHLKASFAARDLMNFTSLGSSAAIRALAQVLPFFNARLQGMDRLVRGAAADPRRFWAVAGTIGMASALLYLIQGDDDEYQALPDYVRDTYWPVKMGGVWAYIPKPFEVGALGTVVERFTELMLAGNDYQARDFRDSMVGILTNTLAMNPVPQIIKPAGEAWFNYDMFRDQPIDSMAMERLLPQERFNANTSAAAVGIGRALEVSPQKVEHLVRGYFGWLGTQALNVGDLMARPFMDMPASPKRDLSSVNNWLVAGDLFKEAGTTPSKYSERFYRVQREINAIYATASQARNLGDMEQYRELMSRPEMAARPMIANANRQITHLSQQMRAVMADRTMSVADKSQRLSELRARRDAIARRVDERARVGAPA